MKDNKVEYFEGKEDDQAYVESVVKYQYDLELERKDKILANMEATVASFAAMFAGFGYIVSSFPKHDKISQLMVCLFMMIAFVFIIRSLVYLYDVLTPRGYEYLPNATANVRYAIRYMADASNYEDKCVRYSMRKNMIHQYSEAASTNCETNNKRVTARARLHIAMLMSIMFLAAAALIEMLQTRGPSL